MLGLGGGFIVLPILRLAFGTEPTVAAAASLAFVLANSLAASISYLRERRVDLGVALRVGGGGIPASIGGAYLVRYFSPAGFDLAYGAFMIAVATLVLRRGDPDARPARPLPPASRVGLEIATGVALGLVSSLFGIGGGVVLVPILLLFFGIPAHVAAATSSLVLLMTVPFGLATHAFAGHLRAGIALPLSLGALAGGAAGARLARRVSAHGLARLLAYTLYAAAALLGLKHLL